jgi:hypothetical protein
MAYYFNPASADDLKLLHSTIRTNVELENIAPQVEDAIRNLYTEYDSINETYTVKLRGYTDDPDDAPALFKAAYKQAIANAISFVLRNYTAEQGLKRDKRGQREQEFKEGFNPSTFPSWCLEGLALFDIRTLMYSI